MKDLSISQFVKQIIPIAVFIVVYSILTFPVMTRMNYWVWGRPLEDAWESIGLLEWYKHALFDLHVSPLFRSDVFYPSGWDLRYAILPPFYPVLMAPIVHFLGSVVVYNLTLLFTCVFAAYGVFMLATTLKTDWWASLIAGVLYAFCPQRLVYLGGHLNFLLGSMWLPWMLYGLTRALHADKRKVYWMFASGFCFALSVAGAWQFLFLSSGTVFLWVVGTHWDSLLKFRSILRGWRTALFFVLGVGILLVPLLVISMPAQQKIGNMPWAFLDANGTSVSLERIFSPSWLNPLWQKWARKYWPLTNGQDGVVNFSFVSLALICCGVRQQWLHQKRPWWYLVGGGLVLMLGPTLHILGKTVLIQAPENIVRFFSSTWNRTIGVEFPVDWVGRIPVILPDLFIYWLVPPYRSFRHFGRWQLLAALGEAVLTAYVIARILKNKEFVRRTLIGIITLILVLLEFNMQPAMAVTSTAHMQRDVDAWLAAESIGTVFIEYPLSYVEHGQALYYTTFHQQNIVHGYSAVPPAEYAKMRPILELWPADETLDYLKSIGVDYILVNVGDREKYETMTLPLLQENERLRLVRTFPSTSWSNVVVYVFTWVD